MQGVQLPVTVGPYVGLKAEPPCNRGSDKSGQFRSRVRPSRKEPRTSGAKRSTKQGSQRYESPCNRSRIEANFGPSLRERNKKHHAAARFV